MGYRKLTIDDTDYRFIIGKKYTKVQNITTMDFVLYENKKIGHYIKWSNEKYLVRIRDIVNAIKGIELEKYLCEEHGTMTTEVACNPFEREIYSKIHYMINCEYCLDRVAADI